ncbi:sensor histidine kinase [Microbacterium sorbitolivorans]|uniref:histidine kinase n=1 Tax=Microbacterium sorbitolivorans TaxID=1867410 RepID=A0A367XTC2_9MICO|nr:histidine kinase [Microbacterium sorbitolivorans]RCK56873.1 sensor histidine kinase [Microbacterium sorbitolivorans]
MSSISAPQPRVNTPVRLLGATAHLVVVGLLGGLVFAALVTFLSVGLGLLPVLGIGALFLIAFIYLLFATAFTETARVEGLYGFGMPMLRPRRSPKRGFVGFLHTMWLQFIDAGMWRAIAHFAIATVLGWIVLAATSTFASGIAAAFSPLYANGASVPIAGFRITSTFAAVIGVAAAVLSLALIFGLAMLHGVLSRVLIAPIREAQLAAAARDASAQRQDAIRASDVERTRIERDLHDGVQPRLVSVGMTLGLAQQKIDADPEKAKELLAEAHTSTKAAITELRQLARGIHASVLDDRGLDAALSAVASRSHIPVVLDVRMPGRVDRDAEAAVYFAIAESLTNAAKHSRATEARVTVRARPETGSLWARVEDNGVGGARVLAGGGLDGIQNRIAALGGTCRLDSPAGGPTSLEVSVPCAS